MWGPFVLCTNTAPPGPGPYSGPETPPKRSKSGPGPNFSKDSFKIGTPVACPRRCHGRPREHLTSGTLTAFNVGTPVVLPRRCHGGAGEHLTFGTQKPGPRAIIIKIRIFYTSLWQASSATNYGRGRRCVARGVFDPSPPLVKHQRPKDVLDLVWLHLVETISALHLYCPSGPWAV